MRTIPREGLADLLARAGVIEEIGIPRWSRRMRVVGAALVTLALCLLALLAAAVPVDGQVPEDLPSVDELMDHLDDLYRASSSHQARPMHPAPPIPAAQVMLPPLATRSVEPSSQTTNRTPVSSTLRATAGRSSSSDMSAMLSGAVDGSNQGYSLSSNSVELWTRISRLPLARESEMQSTKSCSASWVA